MTRVDTNDLSTLGSFKAVPFQPFGTITAPTSSFSLIIIAGIIIAVAGCITLASNSVDKGCQDDLHLLSFLLIGTRASEET